MLSLLRALLFRPHAILEHLLKNPSPEASSRLGFLIIVLTMIDTAIMVGMSPKLDTYVSPMIKWLLVLILPPIEYLIQRFFFVLTSRLGLLMFASDKMPRTPEERQEKTRQLKLVFPYIIYPMAFFSLLAAPFYGIVFVQDWFFILGMVYYFLLSVFALRTMYGVSSNVAFWSPILVQFIVFIVIAVLLTILVMIGLLAGVIPELPNPM
ncbi:hypothetical protein [Tumebacillus permanentifrigoris]|uniref:Yip1-like protein n=1 Tax=Tumebacillus permanentifrigoris TaxID=378543 RepID=A0A316DAR0_9BACL|nr:hypothetical protein [Tumebacillus permanentifrigoris]PWK10252.1 hypothetical protein C7459_11273 [Tumebacillus permanentifrigoris]